MDLLFASAKQVGVVLLLTNVVVFLTEKKVLGPIGWKVGCIMLIALGVFSLRIFVEIAWKGLRRAR